MASQSGLTPNVGKDLQTLPPDDLKTPGGQSLGGPEGSDPIGEDKEGFLNSIQDLVGWAEPAGEPMDPGPPEPQNGIQCFRIPGHRPFNEDEFGFGHGP